MDANTISEPDVMVRCEPPLDENAIEVGAIAHMVRDRAILLDPPGLALRDLFPAAR